MDETFDFHNGRDILDRFQFTVFDDRAIFDGASMNTIRQHFQLWSSTTPTTEQQQQLEGGGSTGIRVRIG